MPEDLSFYLTGIKFKIGAENKGRIHPVENNRGIYDDLEFQLIVWVKVKMLCENLKTPIWHSDDGWRNDVIDQICLWGDEFEILQYITSTFRYLETLVGIFHFTLAYVCWEQQNCPNLHKNGYFDHYFLRCVIVLEIGGTPIYYAETPTFCSKTAGE